MEKNERKSSFPALPPISSLLEGFPQQPAYPQDYKSPYYDDYHLPAHQAQQPQHHVQQPQQQPHLQQNHVHQYKPYNSVETPVHQVYSNSYHQDPSTPSSYEYAPTTAPPVPEPEVPMPPPLPVKVETKPTQPIPPAAPLCHQISDTDDKIVVKYGTVDDDVDYNSLDCWLQTSEFFGCFLGGLRFSFATKYQLPDYLNVELLHKYEITENYAKLIDVNTGKVHPDLSYIVLLAIFYTDDSIFFRIVLCELLLPLASLHGTKAHLVELLSERRSKDNPLDGSVGFLDMYYDVSNVLFGLKTFLVDQDEEFDDIEDESLKSAMEILNSNEADVSNLLGHKERASILKYLLSKLLVAPEFINYIDYVFGMGDIRKQTRKDRDNAQAKAYQKDLIYLRKDVTLLRNHLGELRLKLDILRSRHADDHALGVVARDIEVIEKAILNKAEIEKKILDKIEEHEASHKNDFRPEEHQMRIFFLQNQPVGADRDGKTYWIFQTVRGVFVNDENKTWFRHSTEEDLAALRNAFHTPAEVLIGDYINYWLSKPDKAHMLLDDSSSKEFKKIANREVLSLHRTHALFNEIIRFAFLPVLNEPSDSRYQHFLSARQKTNIIEPGEIDDLVPLRNYIAGNFKALAITQNTPKKPQKKNSKKQAKVDYSAYPPLIFCFSDHDIQDVRTSDLRNIENALTEWERLASACTDGDSLSILITLLFQAVYNNVSDEDVYKTNGTYGDWIMDKTDDQSDEEIEELPRPKRAKRS